MRYYVVAIFALVLGVGVFLHTVFYSDSWQQREKARVDLETLKANNDGNDERLRSMHSRIDALRNRPEVQERAVRHELGYIGPGEVVLELGGQR